MKKLHHRIKESRKKLGLSQSELASLCKVSQPTIANWERAGHIPRRAALEKIANCLNVEPLWLLSGETALHKNIINTYLSTPIHHIPIYRFEDDASGFKDSTPIKFISLSIANGDLFGLEISNENKNKSEIHIFDRDMNLSAFNGDYLIRHNNALDLVSSDELDVANAEPIGKLCLTMTWHESPPDQT